MGSSPTSPTAWPDDPAGIKQTIRRALENAESKARDIQAIYAAANGGKVLDAVEAEAYAQVFSGLKKQPLITSKARWEKVFPVGEYERVPWLYPWGKILCLRLSDL